MKRISAPVFLSPFLLIVSLSILMLSGCNNDNDNSGVQEQTFKGHGNLAFVQQGLLYTLNGTTGDIKQITDSGRDLQPAWSHDGQWLAYINITEQDSGSGQLWLARQDGSPARPIPGLSQLVSRNSFSWSSTANLLAVVMPDGIWLVPAEGEPYRLVQCKETYSLAWSPDGNTIAYSATLPLLPAEEIQDRSDALYTIALDEGRPVEQLVAKQAGIRVGAWWPDGKGLLYWTAPFHASSLAADGLPLSSLRLGDSEHKYLATGLAHKGWLSLSPQGALMMVSGMDRIVWANKSLAIINPVSGARQNLVNPAGCVSLDPTFSPKGDRITFVAAKDLGDEVWGFNDPEDLTAWINTRTLWLAQADGSNPRPLTLAGTGVYQPLWSKDGKSILYVRDNALWLINSEGGQTEKIVDLLSEGEDLFGFYGYLSYQDFIAWHQP